MENKFSKQLWLETVLKKLYKKVDSLSVLEKPRNCQKKKLNVPVTPYKAEIGSQKRKRNVSSQIMTSSKQLKRQPKKNCKERHSEHNEEKFWDFVDEFVESKPFHGDTKRGFFNSVKIPSSVNYTLWKSVGYLKSEASLPNEEKVLEEKVFLKIQKVRMKRATDAIAKEVLEERNAEKY